MLTVIREMAARDRRADLAHMRGGRASAPTRRPSRAGRAARRACSRTPCAAGEAAVERTPEQLEVLREAGVVDAGGARPGRDPRRRRRRAARRRRRLAGARRTTRPATDTRPHHEDSRFRYCTNFIVTGAGLESRSFVAAAGGARRLGAGRRRRGDAQGPRPHRRAARPRWRSSTDAGDVSQLDVADMREQIAERTRASAGRARARPSPSSRAAGCASCTRGSARSSSTAARPSTPRSTTCSPRIHEVPAEEVLVLSQQSERDHGRRAGGRALGQAGPGRSLRAPSRRAWPRWSSSTQPRRSTTNAERIDGGAGGDPRRVGRARPPATTPRAGSCSGDAVGFVGDEIVAWGGAGSTLTETMDAASPRAPRSSPSSAARARRSPLEELAGHAPEGVELELHEGGPAALLVAARGAVT